MWKLFRCEKCGFTGEFDLNMIAKLNLEAICPHCFKKLVMEEDNELEDNALASHLENNTNELIPNHMKKEKKKETSDIKIMKWKINCEGDKFIWGVIENIKNASQRLQERELFFQAGGYIPKRKVQI